MNSNFETHRASQPEQTQLPWVFDGRKFPQWAVPSSRSSTWATYCLMLWCLLAHSLSLTRALSLSLSQMKRKDNALWWVLTPLEMLVQKFIITPQIPEKCYLLESNRADSMVKCPASSSHLIPTLLAEKLLAFSSFTLSISSWKEHCTYDGRKTPVKKHIGYLVVISFISETATDVQLQDPLGQAVSFSLPGNPCGISYGS